MAASTLHSLLIRLGFETSGLTKGAQIARQELDSLQASASRLALSFVPATTSLTNLTTAAKAVQGSVGGTQALNTLAKAAKDLDTITRGSDATLNKFAITARRVAEAGQATQLEALSSAMVTIARATGGASRELNKFLMDARAVSDARPGSFATWATETARHYQQASTWAQTYTRLLAEQAKVVMVNTVVARTQAAQQQAIWQSLFNAKAKMMLADQIVAQSTSAAIRKSHDAMIASQMKYNMVQAAASQQMAQRVSLANAQFAALGQFPGNAIAGGLDKVAKSANGVAEAATHAGNRASFMQRTLSMAFAFSGGVAVTNVIAFVSNALLGFNSRIEQSRIAFDNLLGSEAAASAFIDTLGRFADVTPFDYAGLEGAVLKLVAMGFAADEALPTLRAIGDAVAGLGGNSEMIDRVALAMGQMSAAGRVNSQDMRQLTEARIPAWRYLAESIGKTTGETRKLAEAGLIPAGKALAAIIEGMDKDFGGQMARQARTGQGALNTLRDVMVRTISEAVRPFYDALVGGALQLVDFFMNGGMKYVAPVIYAIATALTVALIPKLYGAAVAAAAANASFGALRISLFPLIMVMTLLGIAVQENWMGVGDLVRGAAATIIGALEGLSRYAAILIPIMQVLITLIAVKFVAGLLASGAAALVSAAGITVDTIATNANTASKLGMTVAMVKAAAAAGGLRGAMTALVGLVGGAAVAAVGLWAAAIVLLVLNFDRVVQGLRVINWALQNARVAIFEFLASIPGIGDAFKTPLEEARASLAQLVSEMAAAEAAIKAAESAKGSAEGDDIFAQMDADMQKMLDSLRNGTPELESTTQSLVDTFGSTISGITAAAEFAGAEAMKGMADEIKSNSAAPIDALKSLVDSMANAVAPTDEIAQNLVILNSPLLAEALRSGIPEVVAAAEATRKAAVEQLDRLSEGAYSAGLRGALSYAEALSQARVQAPYLNADGQDRLAQQLMELSKINPWSEWKPSVDQMVAAEKRLNAELANTQARAEALREMESAFSEIKSAAMEYFQAVHDANLRAIDDELRHKQAILDTKAALNQAPVDAAQRALDARRAQIQEWRLREAVRTASGPEAQRDAILALEDFLAQQHINQMQNEVDNAKKIIDSQKERLDERARLQKDAENRRYEEQKRSFERELQLLQEYLSKHPGEWQNVQNQVLGLLQSYGFSYDRAGQLLGNSFTDGLKESLREAMQAAKRAAEVIGATLSGTGTGTGGIEDWQRGGRWDDNNTSSSDGRTIGGSWAPMFPTSTGTGFTGGMSTGDGTGGGASSKMYATGAWAILEDNVRAMLHYGEMVLPREQANLLRPLGQSRMSFPAQAAFSGGSGGGAARNIHVYIGDEKVGDVVDKAMYDQDAAYGGHTVLHTGRSAR